MMQRVEGMVLKTGTVKELEKGLVIGGGRTGDVINNLTNNLKKKKIYIYIYNFKNNVSLVFVY